MSQDLQDLAKGLRVGVGVKMLRVLVVYLARGNGASRNKKAQNSSSFEDAVRAQLELFVHHGQARWYSDQEAARMFGRRLVVASLDGPSPLRRHWQGPGQEGHPRMRLGHVSRVRTPGCRRLVCSRTFWPLPLFAIVRGSYFRDKRRERRHNLWTPKPTERVLETGAGHWPLEKGNTSHA